jgi:hypothetical protein
MVAKGSLWNGIMECVHPYHRRIVIRKDTAQIQIQVQIQNSNGRILLLPWNSPTSSALVLH